MRRVIQERMGERFVKELGGQVLDTGLRGTLYEVPLLDDAEQAARYVEVRDAHGPDGSGSGSLELLPVGGGVSPVTRDKRREATLGT